MLYPRRENTESAMRDQDPRGPVCAPSWEDRESCVAALEGREPRVAVWMGLTPERVDGDTG